MGDPLTMAMVGAGMGAATSEDPLKGALLGGFGGYVGGTLFGPAGGAGTGVTAGSQQASMLAAQNQGLGLGANALTNQALAANVNPMMSGAYGMAENMSGQMPRMAMMAMNNRQPQTPAPVGRAPQINPNAGGSFTEVSPYRRGQIGPNPGQAMFRGYNRNKPF